jgi:NAD-dependent deacetylase
MEKRGLLQGIITQNIDNLHQRAGSRNVINYHGSVEQAVCVQCHITVADIGESIPVCNCCGRIMKPGFTLFGETVPPSAYLESRNLASFSDVFMVIGTSAVVQPAADLPFTAKENGAFVIELNSVETGLSNYITGSFIKGPAEETLPYLVSKL